MAAGRNISTLTNHKKAIRSMLFHHEEYTFASGAADNIKVNKSNIGMEMSRRIIYEKRIWSLSNYKLHGSKQIKRFSNRL